MTKRGRTGLPASDETHFHLAEGTQPGMAACLLME
jgi:hypothetical protein